jgi:hypothetical protein
MLNYKHPEARQRGLWSQEMRFWVSTIFSSDLEQVIQSSIFSLHNHKIVEIYLAKITWNDSEYLLSNYKTPDSDLRA